MLSLLTCDLIRPGDCNRYSVEIKMCIFQTIVVVFAVSGPVHSKQLRSFEMVS